MMKRIVIVAAIVFLVAFAGNWFYSRNSDQSGSMEAEILPQDQAVFAAPLATNTAIGTVTEVSSVEMALKGAAGSMETFKLTQDSRFLRVTANALPSGSPVYVLYSKLQDKAVSALLVEPIIESSSEQTLEIISGELLSVEGNELKMTVGGSSRSFVFDTPNFLPVSTKLESVSGVEVNDEVTVEYTESPEGKVAVSIILK